MVKNLYVMQDRVSHVYGEVLESENDATMRRSFKNVVGHMYASGVPVKDVIVYRIGSIDKSKLIPVIHADPVSEVVLRGDESEFAEACACALSACTDPVV